MSRRELKRRARSPARNCRPRDRSATRLCGSAPAGCAVSTAKACCARRVDLEYAPTGQDIRIALGLDEKIFTLKLTPNRADCLSVFGIAREVAAITGAPLH